MAAWPGNQSHINGSATNTKKSTCHHTNRQFLLFIVISFITLNNPPRTAHSSRLPTSFSSVSLQQEGDIEETRCLACIKSVTSAGVDPSKRCEGGNSCGPFQISYQYWAEAGKPASVSGGGGNGSGASGVTKVTRDFEKCARDEQCAEQTVRAYFKKFRRDCSNDGLVDCLDMAALHKAGPMGCSQNWFYKSRYWLAFNKTSCASSDKRGGSEMNHANQNQQQVALRRSNQTLTTECLDCICEGLASCNAANNNNCGSGLVCGPFAISQAYWKDGRRPGASWTACARTRECSSVTIRNYMDKYKRDCNGDGLITCEDYAAIHRRGPMSCTNRDLLREQYWMRFQTCRANQKSGHDANSVKVGHDETSAIDAATSLLSNSSEYGLISTVSPKIEQSVVTTSTFLSESSSNLPLVRAEGEQIAPITTQPLAASRSPALRIQTLASTSVMPELRPTANSLETYDLNPIVLETKATSNQIRNFQTVTDPTTHLRDYAPLQHQASDSSDRLKSNNRIQNHIIALAPQVQLEMTPSHISLDTSNQYLSKVTQSTIHYQTEAPPTSKRSSPIIDYNALPTIIVSKPLGSQSISRISQAPSLSMSHTDYGDEQSSTMTVMADGAAAVAATNTVYLQPPSTVAPSPSIITNPTTGSAATSTITHSASSYGDLTTSNDSGLVSSSDIVGSNKIERDQQQLQQQQDSLSSVVKDDQQLESAMDLSVPDFGSAPGVPVDRASFDRVVNGIMANADFSKSYPPVPEAIGQRKQPIGPPPPLSNTQKTSHANKDYAHATTRSSPIGPDSHFAVSTSPNKRENSKTLSPNIYNSMRSDTAVVNSAQASGRHQTAASSGNNENESIDHQSTIQSSNLGTDALNISNLFEKIGLNETNRIAGDCLDCICDASSNCDTTVQCISKQREKNRCGLYMISWNQYKESDISLTAMMLSTNSGASASSSSLSDEYDEKLYYECTIDKNCAEKLIHLYIEKYQKDCNNDGKIDCYDIAAIHRVGPDSCNSDKFLCSQYWKDFNHCYATDRLTTTEQPMAQSSHGS